MVFETVAIIAVVLFGALVAAAIPTLLQLRRTLNEAQHTLAVVRQESAPLIASLNALSSRVGEVADEVHSRVQQMHVLFRAMEDLGQQVRSVQGLIQGRGGAVYASLRGVVAGLQAATGILRERFIEGGVANGRK